MLRLTMTEKQWFTYFGLKIPAPIGTVLTPDYIHQIPLDMIHEKDRPEMKATLTAMAERIGREGDKIAARIYKKRFPQSPSKKARLSEVERITNEGRRVADMARAFAEKL